LEHKKNFIELKNDTRIWAIGSIHSNLSSFNSLKNFILSNFKNGDKIVFLGNVIGLGLESRKTLSSVIEFRFKLMSKYLLNKEDVIFLRGAQEEMLSKVLQLQTAPNPYEIIEWMFDHGVDATIKSYGFEIDEIINISTSSTVNISKWTSKLNKSIQSNPGHKEYLLNLKHAAYSSTKKILFVNRGVDISRPLSAQSDCFWWGFHNFSQIENPYKSFIRIVRGYQSKKNIGIENSKNSIICTLFRQPLSEKKVLAGLFGINGEILDLFESN